jgi:hypothetical protein
MRKLFKYATRTLLHLAFLEDIRLKDSLGTNTQAHLNSESELKFCLSRIFFTLSKGGIFDTCRISATLISASKRLAVVVNTNKIVQYKLKHLFVADKHVAEIWQALKFWPKVQTRSIFISPPRQSIKTFFPLRILFKNKLNQLSLAVQTNSTFYFIILSI